MAVGKIVNEHFRKFAQMQSSECQVDDVDVTVPYVRSAKRQDVGGCNGCTSKDENITVIELRSISFRLCRLCKSILHSKLAR